MESNSLSTSPLDIRDVVGNTPRYKKVWAPGQLVGLPSSHSTPGHAIAMCLGAAPHKWPINDELRVALDGWRGPLATVMGNGVDFGYFRSYARCIGTDDLIDGIIRRGPAVCGIPWTESMSNPAGNGLLEVDGGYTKFHYVLANGYWPRHPDFGDVIVLTGPWGPSWGIFGRGYVTVEDMGSLLEDCGSAFIPLDVAPRVPKSSLDDEVAEEEIVNGSK
jgi:hypothetical protein